MPLPRSPTRRPAADGAAAPRNGVVLDPVAAEHPIGEGTVVTRGENRRKRVKARRWHGCRIGVSSSSTATSSPNLLVFLPLPATHALRALYCSSRPFPDSLTLGHAHPAQIHQYDTKLALSPFQKQTRPSSATSPPRCAPMASAPRRAGCCPAPARTPTARLSGPWRSSWAPTMSTGGSRPPGSTSGPG